MVAQLETGAKRDDSNDCDASGFEADNNANHAECEEV
jgi:hypothetical protein